jgi:hypothetical protein
MLSHRNRRQRAAEQRLADQVKPKQSNRGASPMQSARYHRCQAELCLEMARLMSDRHAADALCAAAARHVAQAAELEKQAGHFGHPTVGVNRDE